jgi:hypothetical protein
MIVQSFHNAWASTTTVIDQPAKYLPPEGSAG